MSCDDCKDRIEMTECTLRSIDRRVTWEQCKGKLRSLPETFTDNEEKAWRDLRGKIERFINDVETSTVLFPRAGLIFPDDSEKE